MEKFGLVGVTVATPGKPHWLGSEKTGLPPEFQHVAIWSSHCSSAKAAGGKLAITTTTNQRKPLMLLKRRRQRMASSLHPNTAEIVL
jgi:hypothetical protein